MSRLVVYLWMPMGEFLGHSSMKIAKDGQVRYFSWFPAKQSHFDRNILRSNPPSYGPNATAHGVITTAVNEKNEKDFEYMAQRQSDKDELKSPADYKFIFTEGINFDAVWAFWMEKYGTTEKWSRSEKKNCNWMCLNALKAGINKVNFNCSDTLENQAQAIKLTSESVYTYCLRIAKYISSDPSLPAGKRAIVRVNSHNYKNPAKLSLDFDPTVWNPHAHTRKRNFDYLVEKGLLEKNDVKKGYADKTLASLK